MKRIKTAELKSRLSHYLREVQSSDEPIEVCVREQAVAYLTKIDSPPPMRTADMLEHSHLQQRLAAVGLVLGTEPPLAGTLPEVAPLPAGDGRTKVCTVEEMRSERHW